MRVTFFGSRNNGGLCKLCTFVFVFTFRYTVIKHLTVGNSTNHFRKYIVSATFYIFTLCNDYIYTLCNDYIYTLCNDYIYTLCNDYIYTLCNDYIYTICNDYLYTLCTLFRIYSNNSLTLS